MTWKTMFKCYYQAAIKSTSFLKCFLLKLRK
jgi:hypothetical protein